MPVFRPLTSSSVSNIAVIARHKGIYLQQFEPDECVLAAEGAEYTLNSANVNGMGLVLHHDRIENETETRNYNC